MPGEPALAPVVPAGDPGELRREAVLSSAAAEAERDEILGDAGGRVAGVDVHHPSPGGAADGGEDRAGAAQAGARGEGPPGGAGEAELGRAAALGYPHWGLTADLRAYRPGLGGVTAARLWASGELMKGAPLLRLPTVGGAELHRGAWAGRYRAPFISTLDLEQRWALIGPLEGVVFGNLAYVIDDGLHPAGGLGLRLILPPERLNVVRLDVAVSDSAWAITTGWGEAF